MEIWLQNLQNIAMEVALMQPYLKSSSSTTSLSFLGGSSFSQNQIITQCRPTIRFRNFTGRRRVIRGRAVLRVRLMPVDAFTWTLNIDAEDTVSQLLSSLSLFPYLGFLYFMTRSKSTPKLTLFGIYFLLVFVGTAIPAGLYAKLHFGTSLSNVDWLHGGAESLLCLTNLFIVLGLRQALRRIKNSKQSTRNAVRKIKEKPPI